MKNGVARVPCACKHDEQDKLYGVGQRVANATAKQDKDFIEVRCTVCAKVQRVKPERVR